MHSMPGCLKGPDPNLSKRRSLERKQLTMRRSSLSPGSNLSDPGYRYRWIISSRPRSRSHASSCAYQSGLRRKTRMPPEAACSGRIRMGTRSISSISTRFDLPDIRSVSRSFRACWYPNFSSGGERRYVMALDVSLPKTMIASSPG